MLCLLVQKFKILEPSITDLKPKRSNWLWSRPPEGPGHIRSLLHRI